jgi:hypothetical protein
VGSGIISRWRGPKIVPRVDRAEVALEVIHV